MEVYILDSFYRRTAVVDTYESLLWAERFSSLGDFDIRIASTPATRRIFVPGVMLALNVSKRVMTIQTAQDYTDEEGRRMLKLTGPSLEDVLRHRMLAMVDDDVWVNWTATGIPKALAGAMFHDICVSGDLDSGDIMPSVTEGSIYPADTIEEPDGVFTYTPDISDLYQATKDLCDAFNMGFRLVRDLDTSILYYDIYMGSDRTTNQTTLAAVVFSPDLENLRNTNKLNSMTAYKNVAYVYNTTDHEIVYLEGVDPLIDDFERRVLTVKVDEALTSDQMIQKGKDALAQNRQYVALDGALATNSSYIYDTHYSLGDMVELRDDDGSVSHMQVTEQIFVHDKEGERSYPTLTVNEFVTPGSWIAWDFAQEWDDLDDEHWDELP